MQFGLLDLSDHVVRGAAPAGVARILTRDSAEAYEHLRDLEHRRSHKRKTLQVNFFYSHMPTGIR